MSFKTILLFLFICLPIALLAFPTTTYSKPALLPDPGTRIVFITDIVGHGSNLYWVSLDGTEFHYLIPVYGDLGERYVDAADCSASGRYIVFSTGGGLHRMKFDGTELFTLLTRGHFGYAAWSPDETRIVFNGMLSDYSRNNEVFLVDANGENLVQLTDNDYSDYDPAWSPDGQKIVFAYNDDGVQGLAIMDADGSNLHRITETSVYENAPSWSPDGQLIAFMSKRDGSANIYTIRPDGSGLVQLTAGNGDNIEPRWSPDGTQISFSSDREGFDLQIYVMDANGSNARRVTPSLFDRSMNVNGCWLVPMKPDIEGASQTG